MCRKLIRSCQKPQSHIFDSHSIEAKDQNEKQNHYKVILQKQLYRTMNLVIFHAPHRQNTIQHCYMHLYVLKIKQGYNVYLKVES